MKILFTIIRIYLIFVSLIGLLFGQVFYGKHITPVIIACFCGILAGVYSGEKYKNDKRTRKLLKIICLGGLMGVFLDANGYYSNNVSGNEYAWELIVPFCTGLIIILYKQFSLSDQIIE